MQVLPLLVAEQVAGQAAQHHQVVHLQSREVFRPTPPADSPAQDTVFPGDDDDRIQLKIVQALKDIQGKPAFPARLPIQKQQLDFVVAHLHGEIGRVILDGKGFPLDSGKFHLVTVEPGFLRPEADFDCLLRQTADFGLRGFDRLILAQNLHP